MIEGGGRADAGWRGRIFVGRMEWLLAAGAAGVGAGADMLSRSAKERRPRVARRRDG